jgi:glutamate dehydrogenase
MTRKTPAPQRRLIHAIAARGKALKLPRKLPVNRSRFLEQYYALADKEDLAAEPRTLAAAALGHLLWATRRPPNTALVRVFNPRPEKDGWGSVHTIVETANDDMPFLVDSLTMALSSSGHGIQATIHPVLRIVRTPGGLLKDIVHGGEERAGRLESLIHIEITRVADPHVLRALERDLAATLRDVRASVEDWASMLDHLVTAANELGENRHLSPALRAESRAFLTWLADDRFTLVGYREHDLTRGPKVDRLAARPGSGLGILRERGEPTRVAELTGAARAEARSSNPLVVTKSDLRSTVHRPALLDYVGVKLFDDKGRPCAERRFLGLFTSVAYHERPRDIPLLRLKVGQVMQRSGFDPRGHRGKALQHILDTFPRDDLFQISIDDLYRVSMGILGLQERHRVRLFHRRDTFGRFYSCLVYLPRDQYNARARRQIEQVLEEGFGGTSVETDVTISESALARLAVTVRTPRGSNGEPDVEALQSALAEAVRGWPERVREALLARLPEGEALALLSGFPDGFSAAYQEEVDPIRASRDIEKVAAVASGASELEMRLERPDAHPGHRLRFTTFKGDHPIQLYVALPILENMGLMLISERIYNVNTKAREVWIQDFELATPGGADIDSEAIAERFTECFARVLTEDADNDRFNAFVIGAGLDWRQAALLRGYCRYVLQTGLPFSQAYMQEVLERYPTLCKALIERFKALFDPDLDASAREQMLPRSEATIRSELDRATSLDEDRILRSFACGVDATLRTNFFQHDASGALKAYLSFKLDPAKVAELPRPLPKYEIFVYSQRVEGVHLRTGKISRGGIRWSDRREDFRTEVLGLMKAQHVKNTVIVPGGAKGGFVCKRLPSGDRERVQEEVVHCYRTFIRGMLDLTDNIVDSQLVSPPRVLARDDEDPYLVVAADRGTAAFSDLANTLAAEYGFWLGDAFASGGSAGYDHKKMAITARGAWESVKRHFREVGIDVQKQPFTVIGIGDMSGDVFGNGLLLSPHIRLVAAFDHRHIFIDPNPDAAVGFEERRRLFRLPRSSWADYDRDKLSSGGGIYSRDSKSISLSAAARNMLGIARASLTPPELIKAILRTRADLLWNGGIGTYVKSSRESHSDAGDPANDAVRVNANQIRCRVAGEGGNLGFTQLGRIEYALGGGRINTDFIDNSAGVDSSDREVNIKILLNEAMAGSRLTRAKRDAVLAEMTDRVAELVLANNYGQTQALSMMASQARQRLGEHARLIRLLEARGLLDRSLEHLPSEDGLDERRTAGRGLTRPELAIILSYSKIQLTSSLAESDIPEDPFLAAELEAYFPGELSERFADLVQAHRLRRQIIAMLISSSMINRMGPFFVLRAVEETGAAVSAVARAYAIVREIFGVRRLWRDIESLDYTVQPEVQYSTMFQISRMVRRAVYWFLQHHAGDLDIEPMVERFRPPVAHLLEALPTLVSGRLQTRFSRDVQQLQSMGLPTALAQHMASLGFMTQILDIIELGEEHRLDLDEVARLHFELSRGLKLDWLREQIEGLQVEGRWRAMARATLRETLAEEQRVLLRTILAGRGRRAPRAALAHWMSESKARISRARQAIDEMQTLGPMDFATLSVALKEIARLA